MLYVLGSWALKMLKTRISLVCRDFLLLQQCIDEVSGAIKMMKRSCTDGKMHIREDMQTCGRKLWFYVNPEFLFLLRISWF